METSKRVRVIVEFTPAKGSKQSYNVYSIVLLVPLEPEVKDLKAEVRNYWDKLDKHQQWTRLGFQLPKQGELKILAIKKVDD
jgi:hypothetical protein